MCTTCPPGEGTLVTETGCFATCVPCERGYFNDVTGSHICTRCSECERNHRTTLTPCTRYKNAYCGPCIDG
ncbi:hypothetical protein NP493_243g03151 [Ridgeia piscesae]|uniref:TNFR-Cys domain-containing protein n=1 Tax=Ridgeia piscesae TaxID=27915 RepID=A0AAD9NZC9_RIDPI|nr:hypothetical protein NP493_243g03151 [Ridgeia piscesae]